MTEHDRIWLEPAGAPDRCWCQDNQWGDEGVEYVLASTIESLQRENEELRKDKDHIAAEKAGIARNAHINVDYWKSQAEAAEAGVNRLREALQNVIGCYDTPLSRRRFPPDGFMTEAINTARTALASTGCEHHADK